MNNYKSFAEIKEEFGSNYDFKLYEMGISALKEIEQLQQENEQLNALIKEYQKTLDEIMPEKMDIENNWNKLKEYMIKEQARIVIENTDENEFVYTDLLNKMQELEGSDSNE